MAPAGFRTPGGFNDGLTDRPDFQSMLKRWVHMGQQQVPRPPARGTVGQAPDGEVIKAIVAAQAQAQPFVYPSGLIELPMNPVSDVTALRSGRWPLEAFLKVIRASVTWAIDTGPFSVSWPTRRAWWSRTRRSEQSR